MRSMRIVTVFCWIIAAVALLGLAFWFLSGTVFGSSGLSFIGIGWDRIAGSYETVGTYSVGPDSIDSISIVWVSGEVSVNLYEGNEIQFTESARRELRDDEHLRYNASGGALIIEFSENNFTLRNMASKKLEVYIPRALSGNLAGFDIDATSADVVVEDISAEIYKVKTVSGNARISNPASRTLDVGTTSGEITVSSADAGDIKLHSVSGSVRLSEADSETLEARTSSGTIIVSSVNAGGLKLHSISGSVRVSDADARTLDCDTTSGDVDLSGSFAGATLKSTSGRLSITSAVVPESLNARTSSVNIIVTVPDEGAIAVCHSSASGKLSSDIPIITQGSDAQFYISTTSGNAKIQALG